MLFRFVAVLALLVASTLAHAQSRIAVVNLEEAILQTDSAQQRLRDFEAGESFAEDKAEFDSLKESSTSWCRISSVIRRQ